MKKIELFLPHAGGEEMEKEKNLASEEQEALEMEQAEQEISETETNNMENVDTINEESVSEEEQNKEENPQELINQLTDQIKQLEQQLEEKENRILRIQADFDNYRKRTRNEIEAIEKYRSQALALEILPSVDNFERALQTEAKSEDGKSILQGMEMIYKGILDALKKEGIEQMETVGKEFDPKYHHAVMQGQEEDKDSNIILEEYQKGYMLKDRVLRPAMVKVNQ